MNRYLSDLVACFKEIEVTDFHWDAKHADGSLYSQTSENHLSSQLKTLFTNLMKDEDNSSYYDGLKCHFDTLKDGLDPPIQPDLVVHRSTLSRNTEDQAFYIEVKVRNASQEIIDDLKKLKRALRELNFQSVVMLVVNVNIDTTQRHIEAFLALPENQDLTDDDLNKFYLFHAVRNPDNQTATYTTKSFYQLTNG